MIFFSILTFRGLGCGFSFGRGGGVSTRGLREVYLEERSSERLRESLRDDGAAPSSVITFGALGCGFCSSRRRGVSSRDLLEVCLEERCSERLHESLQDDGAAAGTLCAMLGGASLNGRAGA